MQDKKYRVSQKELAYMQMKSIDQILKDRGLDPDGHAQTFHTQNCLHRIVRYMPMVSGMTIKAMIMHTNVKKPRLVLNVPYGKYLFYGKAMEGPPPRIPTDRDLQYDTSKNPLAGPFWDRRLMAAEGDAIAADLQRYVEGK